MRGVWYEKIRKCVGQPPSTHLPYLVILEAAGGGLVSREDLVFDLHFSFHSAPLFEAPLDGSTNGRFQMTTPMPLTPFIVSFISVSLLLARCVLIVIRILKKLKNIKELPPVQNVVNFLWRGDVISLLIVWCIPPSIQLNVSKFFKG